MSGKPNGNWKVTMLKRYGSQEALDEHMASIGNKGGSAKKKTPSGFAYAKAHGLTWHIEAGRAGGKVSRRTKNETR